MKLLVLTLLVATLAASHQLEKRSPDFFDDDYFFHPAFYRGQMNPFFQGRTRGASSNFGSMRSFNFRNPYNTARFFMDYDDLFDDRRKRQTQVSPTSSSTNSRQKRSPDFFDDDDYYLFSPYSRFNMRSFGQGRTRGSSRFFNLRRPFTGRYFIDYDDLFDDRRKRQTSQSGATASKPTNRRQKRSPDFFDDDYFFNPYARFALGGYNMRQFGQGRTRGFSPSFNFQRPFTGRYFFDYDDLFDDRRKRQTKTTDAAARRT